MAVLFLVFSLGNSWFGVHHTTIFGLPSSDVVQLEKVGVVFWTQAIGPAWRGCQCRVRVWRHCADHGWLDWTSHLDVVQDLVDANADVNAKDNDDDTASGPMDMVRFILENGAGINVTDNEGNSAIIHLLLPDHADEGKILPIVERLLSNQTMKEYPRNRSLESRASTM